MLGVHFVAPDVTAPEPRSLAAEPCGGPAGRRCGRARRAAMAVAAGGGGGAGGAGDKSGLGRIHSWVCGLARRDTRSLGQWQDALGKGAD